MDMIILLGTILIITMIINAINKHKTQTVSTLLNSSNIVHKSFHSNANLLFEIVKERLLDLEESFKKMPLGGRF